MSRHSVSRTGLVRRPASGFVLSCPRLLKKSWRGELRGRELRPAGGLCGLPRGWAGATAGRVQGRLLDSSRRGSLISPLFQLCDMGQVARFLWPFLLTCVVSKIRPSPSCEGYTENCSRSALSSSIHDATHWFHSPNTKTVSYARKCFL